MRRSWAVLVLACAACVSPRPAEVLAVANLAPGTEDIAGPVELLGVGRALSDQDFDVTLRMVSAVHVRLPDARPRRIRLYVGSYGFPGTPAFCDTPHAQAVPAWNLSEIRPVGGETHFFAPNVEIGRRLVTVDVITQYISVQAKPDEPPGRENALGMIAVVEELAPGDPDRPGIVTEPAGSAPRDWLACGAFTLPE